MNKKIKIIIINLFIILTIIIGLSLIFKRPIRNTIIAGTINKHQIGNITKKQIEKNKKQNVSFDFKRVESVSDSPVYQSILNGSSSKKQNDLPVIAGIAIPELNLNLPIYKGVSNENLYYGAGTMKENQQMGKGNYALASHNIFGLTGRSTMLFSPLEHAKKGMNVYLTDKENVYTYEITNISIVEPTATYVIDDNPEKSEVTLVTCTDIYATNRIVVKGELKQINKWENTPSSIRDAFMKQYNQIQL